MPDEPAPQRIYHRLVEPDAAAERELGGPERVASGGLRLITAGALQSIGDQVVNAKTVLPWLLSVVGTPVALVGLLVPIRESGSMLPQAALTPWVMAHPRRTRVWVVGALGQGVATLVLAAAALLLEGVLAGVVVLLALAAFALARCLCSMAAKDVQGRTLPKGQRGQVTGAATAVSGVAALGIGLALAVHGPDVRPPVLAALLVGAATMWGFAAVVYAGVPERPQPPAPERGPWWSETLALLRQDRDFRTFVLARALLLVSALSPPFLVTLAARGGSGDGAAGLLTGLGAFVVAQGLASVIGGRIVGRWADRSSRRVMSVGSLVASAVVLAVVVAVAALPEGSPALTWSLVTAYLLISVVHVGVRVARKTYVVDVAEGDERTRYVAVSNTAMGVLLLLTGAVSAALATLGAVAALLFLAALGLLGAVVSRRLPEVSRG
ncbi:MFS transporter [Serinicoccus kebangsaanensis]|uniref:MFS transporter n=1 Tax=Serinicoccus kebangsaanensis TaxID=2602069 RepID=UPI00124DA1B2|nr:MFS transporter [Serinicoccus kebangsaanensis]